MGWDTSMSAVNPAKSSPFVFLSKYRYSAVGTLASLNTLKWLPGTTISIERVEVDWEQSMRERYEKVRG